MQLRQHLYVNLILTGHTSKQKSKFCVHVPAHDVITIRTKLKAYAMATSYGRQFELMMTEISADLVKGLFKERGIEFEESDMDFIRGFFNTPPPPNVSVSVSVEKVVPVEEEVVTKKSKGKVKGPKGPKGKGGKGIAREMTPPVVESPDQDPEFSDPAPVPAPAPPKGKGATKKPKCQATTAKGTPCSKCASEGEVFCSVHLASSSKSSSKKKEEATVTATKKKKPTVSAPAPKHTHGLTSPVPDTGCDLCETHGMPFEIPEYEEEVEEDPELGEKHDPTYTLEEEDFDDIDY